MNDVLRHCTNSLPGTLKTELSKNHAFSKHSSRSCRHYRLSHSQIMFTKTWRKSSNKKTITQKKHSNHSRQRVYTGTDRQISSPQVNTRVNIGKVQAVSKEGILLLIHHQIIPFVNTKIFRISSDGDEITAGYKVKSRAATFPFVSL